MQISGTLGFMLQGVSQQPQRVQPDGHVEEQINFSSDPNSGLTTRPGSTKLHEFPSIAATSFTDTVRVGNTDYLVVCDSSSLAVYSYTGTILSINDPDDLIDYVSANMAVYATDEEIILVNKDMVVQRSSITDDADVVRNWGYAYHLGGEFGRTYRLVMTYADNSVVDVSYTTPFGDNAGDAEATASTAIMAAIRTDMLAHPNFKSTTTVDIVEDVIAITDTATTFRLSAVDGAQNALFRAGVGSAKTFADLPKYAVEGAVVRVRGQDVDNTDDVWLRFDASDTDTVGEGFGLNGVWREHFDPDDMFEFNLDTMPHVLTIENGSATLTYGDWKRRRTGNETIAPVPSFVGSSIKDVGEFSNRLWFLSGANFITSRTDNITDFFRQSAVQIVDSDPIDIRSTGEDKSGLVFGVAYDRNLILFSEMGQFSITGGSAFTPGTASMLRSTNFEMSSRVRPVVAGSTIMMPYRNRIYSGLNELRPSLELDSNAVEDLSKVTKKYIRGTVKLLSASGNSGIALCVTDDCDQTIYVYNFLWEDTRKVQSAFHKWIMPYCARAMYIRDGEVFVWLSRPDKSYLCSILPDTPADFNTTYNSLMDIKQEVELTPDGEYKSVLLDHPGYKFVANESNLDYTVGQEVRADSVEEEGSSYRYTFIEEAPSMLVAGLPFVGTLIPNRPVYTDWRGNRVPSARVVVGKYVIDYSFSGGISASMESIYRGNYEVASNDVFPTDDNPLVDFGVSVQDGSFDIPWGDDNFNSKLVINTNSLQPVTIVEVRWWGQLFRGKT